MGKVRTEQVKRISRQLLDKYPNKFSVDFEKNKMYVTELTNISSTKLRNRVAGYTARLAGAMQGHEIIEYEEEE